MSIIDGSGNVQRIEERAHTPFLNEIGGEQSYTTADLIAEVALTSAQLPDDAPYLDGLHLLALTVAQNSAELGYIQKGYKDRNGELSKIAGASLVGMFNINELRLGHSLRVGRDQWARQTYSERSELRLLLTPSQLAERSLLEQPTQGQLDFLNWSGVLNLGLLRALSKSAALGYLWGNHDLTAMHLAKANYANNIPPPPQPFVRTLETAQALRDGEIKTAETMRGIFFGSDYAAKVNS